MHHFFAYLSRLRHINRWGLMRNTQTENTLEHSMMCCYLAHGLAVIGNTYFGKSYDLGAVLEAAAFHDAPEVITGDLATPIKYQNPAISSAYAQVEEVAVEKLLSMLPQEMQPQYEAALAAHHAPELFPIVKAADKLCAYIKCLEESKAGNREFEKAQQNIKRQLLEMQVEELAYFMEHFLESFLLTLDELN